MKGDVLNYLETIKQQEVQQVLNLNDNPVDISKKSSKSYKDPIIPLSFEDKVIFIKGNQKTMTKNMTQATSIPSFLFTDEFNLDKIIRLRKEINQSFSKNEICISFTSLFIKAISLALNDYPILNSIVNQKTGADGYIYEYTIKKDHNLSVGIDGQEGLIFPNIKKVQEKSVLQIQKILNELKTKAKSNNIESEDMNDGTLTISNIGIYIDTY